MPAVGDAIGDPLYRPVHSVDPEGASHEIDTIYTLSILISLKRPLSRAIYSVTWKKAWEAIFLQTLKKINVIFSPVMYL